MVTKICSICSVEKDSTDFPVNSGGRHGLHSQCKVCRNNVSKYRYSNGDSYAIRLQKLYGLSVDEYEQMYSDANGCCQVCGISEQENNKRLAVDHNHNTGKVRGLLCGKCNTALGQLDDSLVKISSLYSYLKERQ